MIDFTDVTRKIIQLLIMMCWVCERLEKIMSIGENPAYQNYLPFPPFHKYFQRLSHSIQLKWMVILETIKSITNKVHNVFKIVYAFCLLNKKRHLSLFISRVCPIFVKYTCFAQNHGG